MGWSELIYTLYLIGYMQAMPMKLLVISTLVNALVLGVKWIWDF
jgi:hypothetical protein